MFVHWKILRLFLGRWFKSAQQRVLHYCSKLKIRESDASGITDAIEAYLASVTDGAAGVDVTEEPIETPLRHPQPRSFSTGT